MGGPGERRLEDEAHEETFGQILELLPLGHDAVDELKGRRPARRDPERGPPTDHLRRVEVEVLTRQELDLVAVEARDPLLPAQPDDGEGRVLLKTADPFQGERELFPSHRQIHRSRFRASRAAGKPMVVHVRPVGCVGPYAVGYSGFRCYTFRESRGAADPERGRAARPGALDHGPPPIPGSPAYRLPRATPRRARAARAGRRSLPLPAPLG